MTPKRILVLNGHPAKTSLSHAFAEGYAKAAAAVGHEVRTTHLHDLSFDMDYGFAGYVNHKPLEPDLKAFQDDVEWANHVVLTTPMWWGGLPAKLKGLFDRTLLPGFAFDPRNPKWGMPAPMLTGRTARAIVTSDTPNLIFRLVYHKTLLRQIQQQIFKFVGMKPLKTLHFAPAGKADMDKVGGWMKQVEAAGRLGQ